MEPIRSIVFPDEKQSFAAETMRDHEMDKDAYEIFPGTQGSA